jgi:hypothetical protein
MSNEQPYFFASLSVMTCKFKTWTIPILFSLRLKIISAFVMYS